MIGRFDLIIHSYTLYYRLKKRKCKVKKNIRGDPAKWSKQKRKRCCRGWGPPESKVSFIIHVMSIIYVFA